MFVFISPNSIKSNWIYFESGFAYSKGIKVIPIGINGVDIGKLAPPINLLQGFNITSFEGLNNLITIINREFLVSFPENFSNGEYDELLTKSTNKVDNNFHSIYVDYITTEFSKNLTNNKYKESAFNDIYESINQRKLKVNKDYSENLHLYGMKIFQRNDLIIFNIDLLKVEENLNLIINFLHITYTEKIEKYWFRIYFNDEIDLLSTDFKLSSRLSSIGMEISEQGGGSFEYKNFSFIIDDNKLERGQIVVRGQIIDKKSLRIIFPTDGSFKTSDVYDLISTLFSNNIIWIK